MSELTEPRVEDFSSGAGSTPVIHPLYEKRESQQEASPVSDYRRWADLPEWITTQEAAKLSGYHIEYLRNLIRMGRVYAEKKGRDWWIDRDRFRAFVEDQKASGDPRHGPRIES